MCPKLLSVVSQFLERCTEQLNLPFAARRVFTADGKEVLSLASLEKNELIYVSCGEGWNNPSVSNAEQQKRLLLANLASDVTRIKKYVASRNCAGLFVVVVVVVIVVFFCIFNFLPEFLIFFFVGRCEVCFVHFLINFNTYMYILCE